LVTSIGAGGCSLGKQSGGAIKLSISAAVYVLWLPWTFFGPSSVGRLPSYTEYAHFGSRAGGVFN
jgi:hypothetical protein